MLKIVAVLFCIGAAYALTEREPSACELDRQDRQEASTTGILHLIPECEKNGDYAALQCFTANNWCVCYRRNGENINTPSLNIKACDCVRQLDDALNTGDAYKPTCSKDGTFTPKQCLRDECWCVDKEGNVLTDPKTGGVSC